MNAKDLISIGTIILLLLLIVFVGIRFKEESELEVQNGVELTVINKYSDRRVVIVNKVPITTTSYYVTVDLHGNDFVCTISSSEYNSIVEGSSMLFDIYYDKDNVVKRLSLSY